MGQQEKLPKKDFVTKEIFIMMTPVIASYLWTVFYEAGFAQFYGLPFDFIDLQISDILLTNRLTLLAATLAFLWIGLYYNLLPSATSALFKGVITVFLIISISMGSLFGWLDAVNKTDYLVIKSEDKNGLTEESVVLKIYENAIITAPVNRLQKLVYKSFSVHPLAENDSPQMTLEEIGPLSSTLKK